MNAWHIQTSRTPRERSRRRGMGLVELMIALAISSALLTATGFALEGAIQAYHINQEQSILLQNTRLAMNRMLSTVRRCKLHAPDDAALRAQFANGATVTGKGVAMFDVNDVLTTYRYDAATKTILLVTATNTYPLIRGVEDFVVTLEPMRSSGAIRSGTGWDLLRRATMQLTVRTTSKTASPNESQGKLTLTLSASVMPRRNTW